jgi:RNase P subunit RPR2
LVIAEKTAMTTHLYLGVTCKTSGCGNVCALKYFGVDEGQVEIAEMTPTGVLYLCGGCGKTHRYEKEEMYPYRTDFAPPKGWQNGWD